MPKSKDKPYCFTYLTLICRISRRLAISQILCQSRAYDGRVDCIWWMSGYLLYLLYLFDKSLIFISFHRGVCCCVAFGFGFGFGFLLLSFGDDDCQRLDITPKIIHAIASTGKYHRRYHIHRISIGGEANQPAMAATGGGSGGGGGGGGGHPTPSVNPPTVRRPTARATAGIQRRRVVKKHIQQKYMLCGFAIHVTIKDLYRWNPIYNITFSSHRPSWPLRPTCTAMLSSRTRIWF